VSNVVVVMPIKSFHSAKARLAEVLSGPERANLARRCAERVLTAAQPLPVIVVCDDTEVAEWASRHGASVVNPSSPGLNDAAHCGRTASHAAGYSHVLIVHSDLPNATALQTLAHHAADVVIVSDRHGDGTNALLLPTHGEFDFHYGTGSFERHCAEAQRRGYSLAIATRPDLALDLDTIDDLRAAGLAAQPLDPA
jgi:2-phospho-L-lactate guanylyltransferase